MDNYDIFIYFLFFIKIIFVLLAITHIYLKIKGKEKSVLDKKIEYWKERVEFVFVIAMSLLLIYLFTPRTNRSEKIDKETKILLYLFGILLFITAKWEVFVHESKWFYFLQKSVGEVGTR